MNMYIFYPDSYLVMFNPIPVKWMSFWHLPAVFPLFEVGFCSESEQPDGNRVKEIIVALSGANMLAVNVKFRFSF